MAAEDSAEKAAATRLERLKALRTAQELTPDGYSAQNGDEPEDENEEEKNLNMKFRNYILHDKQLQEGMLPDPFVHIAPKMRNWNLSRDVKKKLHKLEMRTQKAIFQLMKEQEKQNQQLAEENDGIAFGE